MAEYQIAANGRDDELGHSFLPEFKRFERFGITLPFNITPQGDVENNGWTTFSVPDIFDRVLSINLAAPSKTTGAWIAEKLVEELVFTSDDHIVQRISADYIRFWYQGLSQDRKSMWDKMTSSTQIGERVYLDLPFAFTQDTGSAIIPWRTLKLHIKWSSRVESLVDTGEVILNTRNILLDRDKYDKTKGDDPLQVMEKYNDTRQLVIQSYEQIEGGYSTSASTFMELRGPCKDIWFGLKANEDFSAHTSDVVTDDLYIVSCIDGTQPHQSLGVVRLSSNILGQTITAANIKVNDDILFAEQKAEFFNQVIPYYRYKGCAAPGFYYYSFALKPQEYQPSGTFNFSRVSSKYLNITNTPYDSSLHILSNRYNITDRNTPVYLD